MKRNILLILGFAGFCAASLQAQEVVVVAAGDSLAGVEEAVALPDSLAPAEAASFKPDATKAVLYSAVFPGLGQIYNRKYWKLPLVYGGVIGCVYAISWNGTQYRGYKNAYRDLFDGNAETNSWQAYNYKYYGGSDEQPENWSASALNGFGDRLKNGRDNFRRNLELSYIISVGVYLLCMIDAYVDAQLFEFDVSEDLSFKIKPALFERTAVNSRSFGLHCSIRF